MGVCKDCDTIYSLRHKATGLIKIGSTNDWLQRISVLGCKGEPDDICESLAVESVRKKDWAVYCLEKCVHSRLKDWRIPGTEWFYCDRKTFLLAWSFVEEQMTRIERRQIQSQESGTSP